MSREEKFLFYQDEFFQTIELFFFRLYKQIILNSIVHVFFFFFFIKLFVLNLNNYVYILLDKIFFIQINIFESLISSFLYNDLFFTHIFFLSNLDLFLFFNFIFVLGYNLFVIYNLNIIPKNTQSKIEFIFNFIMQTCVSHNSLKGQRYFVFFILIFIFILISNFLGMIPFSFTVTSHIFQTFALGSSVILSITILGLSRNGFNWFKLFFPDLPVFILPLFTCIEIVSYISRAFSLAIRLFANLMSGHTLLNILTGFILKIGSKNLISFFISLIPFVLISAIILLEMIIAVLQAYVFVTLCAIYLKDAFNISH